jgi:hypothetical protein
MLIMKIMMILIISKMLLFANSYQLFQLRTGGEGSVNFARVSITGKDIPITDYLKRRVQKKVVNTLNKFGSESIVSAHLL